MVLESFAGKKIDLMSENDRCEQRLHHIGFVVHEIQTGIVGFTKTLGVSWTAEIFHDPLQKVRVTFLQGACLTDPQLELIEPAAEDSPVTRFLQKGGGLHHLCYEVAELDAHLARLRSLGAIIVKPPLPAVAFDNRRIGWVFTKQKLLVELLEVS